MTTLSKFSLRKIMSAFNSAPRMVKQPAAQDEEINTVGVLKPFPPMHSVLLLTTENQVNAALRAIESGTVGFDTEFTSRTPTTEEQAIGSYFPHSPAQRKGAITGLQIMQLHAKPTFDIEWDNVGIRLIQIALDNDVWVIDVRTMRSVPKELVRLLQSANIAKVGVGLIKDIAVIWDDLRMEVKNLVDVGMMAKLVLTDTHGKGGYSNLSLKTSVETVLGYEIDKDLSQSDWSTLKLTDEQINYAALDAVASLKLYDVLQGRLAQKSIEDDVQIPKAWYNFNTKAGEPTRVKKAADGSEVTWKTSDCTWFAGGRFQGYP
ncbi:ribonuclease H-like domain-containing protein [Mycena metata]|uniref:3'-5' exonuclease n=1 Tax=Mycena metata TaxID=1033252 RepID=A0AAD7JL90_9AGAR|nr:ribonuclease H-like domain-containing protein [Mycena metata]